MAYNLLVVTRTALASGLGEEMDGGQALSSYYMATQTAAVVKSREEGLGLGNAGRTVSAPAARRNPCTSAIDSA